MKGGLLCLTIICFCSGLLLSQNSFGLSLGVDFTKTRFKTELTGDPDELSNNGFSDPSLNAGLFLQHFISSKFILDAGISFTQKRNISRFNSQFEATLIPIAMTRVEFGIVKTSGIVKYKIHNKWHAGLGLSHRYIINANTILLSGEARKSSYDRTNMALLFEASYQYKQFLINVSYANGQNFDFASLSAFFNIVKSLDNLELSIRYSLITSKKKNK